VKNSQANLEENDGRETDILYCPTCHKNTECPLLLGRQPWTWESEHNQRCYPSRRRICNECGHLFSTVELDEEFVETSLRLRLNLLQSVDLDESQIEDLLRIRIMTHSLVEAIDFFMKGQANPSDAMSKFRSSYGLSTMTSLLSSLKTIDMRSKRTTKHGVPIDQLELSVRAMNVLEVAGIDTIEKLCQKTPDELLELRNMNETTVAGIEQELSKFGLALSKN
jgi:hypothetical protein